MSPNANMEYSQNGMALTESFEGCRLQAYQDTRGVWTIGYGHTRNVGLGMTCTQWQADAWLQEDIEWAAAAVRNLVTIALTQGEFDALVDFIFNEGIGNFSRSTMLKLLNADDLAGAADEFVKWDLAGGEVVAGLLRRRIAEQQEFNATGESQP